MVVRKRLANAANLPVEFLSAGSYLRPVLRTLEQNNVLLLALDGREARSFKAYPFMGRQIYLSPVMLKLAGRTGAPVLPMLTYRGEDGRHRIDIHPPLPETDPDEMIRHMLKIFESYLIERPEQYAQYMFGIRLAQQHAPPGFQPLFA